MAVNKTLIYLICTFLIIVGCQEGQKPDNKPSEIYFPPAQIDNWQTLSIEDLGWNANELQNLEDLLMGNNTRAFILLKDGKIVIEKYFGTGLLGGLDFNKNSQWYWASAGKTLTAATVSIAVQKGLLDVDLPSSTYLGESWTAMPKEKEIDITVRHHLTMTTGIDDEVADLNDYRPDNLRFLSPPGSRWSYHNALYTLLHPIVSRAVNTDFSIFFNDNLASKIGMKGSWQQLGFNRVYFSDARSMARFGLLFLAKGSWQEEEILDQKSVEEMVNTSQNINPSYGQMWWLNGKASFMIPGVQSQFIGSYAPDAPSDMCCGIGKDGQYVCVVPSENLVMIRMGENPEEALVPFRFVNDIWKQLNKIKG